MSAKLNGAYRKKLRQEILKEHPSLSAKEIFTAMKPQNQPEILFDDLKDLCDKLEIPFSALPEIFSTYGIYNKKLGEEKFIRFLEDEFSLKASHALPKTINNEQAAILSKVITSIKTHKTQSATSSRVGLSSERSSFSQTWIFLTRLSCNNGESSKLRVSALCHYADDYNMSFSCEELIDALFAFFGEPLDAIEFDQFTRLLETF